MPALQIEKRKFILTPSLRRGEKTAVAKGPGKRGGRHREGLQSRGQTYQAGDNVRQSGIYEAVHDAAHRGPHEVVMIEADLFPPCDTCSDRVRFRLVRTAPYIFTDEDFEKPK
jgi:hypothetical protein